MSTTTLPTQVLLNSVLTALQNGVLVYQAVRTDGQITDLRLTMCNAVAEQDMGRPAVEAVGQPFSRLFPHLAGTGLLDRYRRVIETGQAERFEFDYTRPDKPKPLCCDVSVVPLMEDSIVVSYDNITQFKADAEAARQAIVLQQAFDASVNGITVFETVRNTGSDAITDFRFVMINEAGLSMSGFTRDELLGHTLWEIYPATGINGLFSRYVAVCETGQPFAGEHHYPEYDIWREVSIVPVPNGVMVTYNDITTRRKLEDATRQQAQFTENLLESIPAGMAVMNAIRNPDGRLTDFQVVRVNSVLQDIFCLSPAQVLGRPLSVAFAFAAASGLLSRAMTSVELGEQQEFEMPFGSQENRGWYWVSMAPQGDQVILAVTDISDIRRAQLTQHQEAELLQSVMNASQDSIVAVDAVFDETGAVTDFVYVMMNRVGETAINRRLEDIRGKGTLAVFPANRETGLFDMYRQVWETGQPQRTETRYDADGVTGWFLLSIVRRGPGLLITVTDTTGLPPARQLAQDQADTFNAVLHSMMHGLTIFRAVRDETGQVADLQYEHVSEQVVNDTGLSHQQLIGSTILTLFSETKQTRFWQSYMQVLETGEDQQFEHHHHHEGYDHHVIFQVVRVDENRLLSTYQITNELKAAQQKAEEQARLLTAVMTNVPIPLGVYDIVREPSADGQPGPIVDFTVVLASKLVPHPDGIELMGQRQSELYPSEEGRQFRQVLIEVAQTGQLKELTQAYTSDGFRGWFKVAVVRHESRLVVTTVDVTELKQQQQALEVANMELRRSNDNLQQFAYIASHDLQEPLRKIQSFGDMLAANYEDVLDENGRDMIVRMQKAASRMSNLIQDLLNYSRISTERKPFEPLSLTRLMTGLVDDLWVAVRESGAVIDWDDLPDIVGDQMQLKQLFQNLLSNAIKFRLPGIPPRVRVTHRVLSSAALPSSVVSTAKAVLTTDEGKAALDSFTKST